MNSSLYIGASGLKTHSSGLHTLANNLANVSTVGYKQQSILFEDLMYDSRPCLGSAYPQVFNQTGMGSETGAVRTLFTEGAFETSNRVTDLALSGKGFFQVVQDDKTHYTRAGNFSFTKEGYLNDPNGYTLTGAKVTNGVAGALEPIKINLNDEGIAKSAGKATTAVTSVVNLGFSTDSTADPANPYFSLLGAWDGTQSPPLAATKYGYEQPMRVYDANGVPHTATMYFDSTGVKSGSNMVYEYVVAMDPAEDGGAAKGTKGAGLLMSGTLTFSPAGELLDMSAFSPSGGDSKDLNNWKPSALSDGKPQVSMTTADGQKISFTLDLGLKGSGTSWSNAPNSAADVGADPAKLASLGTVTRSAKATTAYPSSSSSLEYVQDGHAIGTLNNLDIKTDGKVVASYSNGTSEVLYEIPVFRFTSEDGLYHEGMNHYTPTAECGAMEHGTAGTENYGKIVASTLETSNVDMAREMTNMIIMQRGFQMNSKTITTTDAMLQKALELKR